MFKRMLVVGILAVLTGTGLVACANSGSSFEDCVYAYDLWVDDDDWGENDGGEQTVRSLARVSFGNNDTMLLVMSERCKEAIEDEVLRRRE